VRCRRTALTVTCTAALIAAGPLAAASARPADPLTERVSVSSAGVQGNNISGRLSRPAVNADGQVVAFDSIATNLVKRDRNRSADIFVRDRSTGKTTLASVSTAGVQGNGDSARPDVSADGRYVAFDSTSTNLVDAPDHNGSFDVFVRDRETGTTTLVSQTPSGAAGNNDSFGPSISADGRFVAFNSDATDLTRQAVTGARDIFVRDMVTGKTHVVSIGQDGSPAGVGANSASISGNGRFVAFASFGSGLVDGDTNDAFDVFVRDRKLGTTTRVSVDSQGGEANGGSSSPAISNDGQRVAFSSDATNLVADDTNGVRDIFVHDSSAGTTTRVSVGPGGVQADGQSDGPGIRGGLSFGPDISRSGRYVTFDSIATNLVSDDTNTCEFPPSGPSFPLPGQCPDVFVHDLRSGTTSRVSVASDGSQADSASTDPAISANGRSVVFFSTATNFDSSDTNTCAPFFGVPGTCPDIYLHQR
jgi:Tol biopolymer transport system component